MTPETQAALERANAEVETVRAQARRLEYRTQHYVSSYVSYQSALAAIGKLVEGASDWLDESFAAEILAELRAVGVDPEE